MTSCMEGNNATIRLALLFVICMYFCIYIVLINVNYPTFYVIIKNKLL